MLTSPFHRGTEPELPLYRRDGGGPKVSLKKHVLMLDGSFQVTAEDLDEIERKYIDFLFDARKPAMVLGPGVTLLIFDFDIDEPCQVEVNGNEVRKLT